MYTIMDVDVGIIVKELYNYTVNKSQVAKNLHTGLWGPPNFQLYDP